MKHRLPLVALASILGCSGSVEVSGSTGGGNGGGGDTATSSSTGGSTGQAGSTGQGGTGGGIFPGGGGAGGSTVTTMSCPVPDKGYFVDVTVDGQPITLLAPCDFDDGMGPMAYFFHGKGGGNGFEITACVTSAQTNPRLGTNAADPTVANTITAIDYVDLTGDTFYTETGTTIFTTYGPVWTNASGTFHGKLTDPNGTVRTLDASFLVCRRPDLYAP